MKHMKSKRNGLPLKRAFTMMVVALLVVCMAAPCVFAAETDADTAADTAGTELVLMSPEGLCSAGDGQFYVTDTDQNRIFLYDAADSTENTLTVFAGKEMPLTVWDVPADDYLDGTLAEARFATPYDIVPWLSGYAVSDTNNNVIRLIKDGKVTTIAGNRNNASIDGKGTAATLSLPRGLATDGKGSLYIADSGTGYIRMLKEDGTVSTVVKGLVDPAGLCYDNGTLYIADAGAHKIMTWKDGVLSTLAGTSEYVAADNVYIGGFVDGSAADAQFSGPSDVAVNDGIIYISDSMNGAIRCIAEGQVSTLLAHGFGGQTVWPGNPVGLCIQDGKIYVADSFCGMLFAVPFKNMTFADVKDSSWYNSTVTEMTARGLVNGTSDTRFSPSAFMNRAMLVTVLNRYEQGKNYDVILPVGTDSFSDVKADSWYADAVSWASGEGIVKGYGNEFKPTASISRQDLAVILYRYAQSSGLDVSAKAPLTDFSDGASVSAYATDACSWAVSSGILGGYKDGTLRPRGSVTRAEACTMLSRYIEKDI